MTTKTEIIKALLDDPMVLCVEAHYHEISRPETKHKAIFFNEWKFDSDSDALTSDKFKATDFDVTYYPTPDIGVGDLVWVEGKGKMFLRSLSGGGFTVSANPKSSTRMFFENKTRISLLEKAEFNDE